MPHVVSCEYAFDGEAFVEGGAQVVVDGAKILAVRSRWAPCPPQWPVLDYPGCTLLPGLIDTHVHLVAGGEPDALALDAVRSAADREQVVRRSLRQQLIRGVTTVRDLGDTRWTVIDREGRDGEPTVVGSGPPITAKGGHCAAMGGEAQGASALRAAVAERHERGCRRSRLSSLAAP